MVEGGGGGLFTPYKSLGLVCEEIPFVLRRMPKKKLTVLLCPVGRVVSPLKMVEGGGGGLFTPYKSLGLVCEEIPFVLRRMPKKKLTVLLCPVGRVVSPLKMVEGGGGGLFTPYKSLGLVCEEIPFVLRRMPKKKLTVLLCPVGRVVSPLKMVEGGGGGLFTPYKSLGLVCEEIPFVLRRMPKKKLTVLLCPVGRVVSPLKMVEGGGGGLFTPYKSLGLVCEEIPFVLRRMPKKKLTVLLCPVGRVVSPLKMVEGGGGGLFTPYKSLGLVCEEIPFVLRRMPKKKLTVLLCPVGRVVSPLKMVEGGGGGLFTPYKSLGLVCEEIPFVLRRMPKKKLTVLLCPVGRVVSPLKMVEGGGGGLFTPYKSLGLVCEEIPFVLRRMPKKKLTVLLCPVGRVVSPLKMVEGGGGGLFTPYKSLGLVCEEIPFVLRRMPKKKLTVLLCPVGRVVSPLKMVEGGGGGLFTPYKSLGLVCEEIPFVLRRMPKKKLTVLLCPVGRVVSPLKMVEGGGGGLFTPYKSLGLVCEEIPFVLRRMPKKKLTVLLCPVGRVVSPLKMVEGGGGGLFTPYKSLGLVCEEIPFVLRRMPKKKLTVLLCPVGRVVSPLKMVEGGGGGLFTPYKSLGLVCEEIPFVLRRMPKKKLTVLLCPVGRVVSPLKMVEGGGGGLFTPYKSLGLVCEEIPFVLRRMPKKKLTVLLCPVGRVVSPLKMVEGGGGGLFTPYKSLGLVCEEIPFVLRRMPKKKLTVLLCPVGRVVSPLKMVEGGGGGLFTPYKSLGLVCEEIPFVLRRMPKKKLTVLLCPVGRVVSPLKMVEGGGGGLFTPYKSLGLVCEEIPFVLRRMPKKKLTVLLCPVGRVVHQYNGQSLRLISVSDPLPAPITAIAADSTLVYVAHGPGISALHLSRQVKYRYVTEESTAAVRLLLPFGAHLIAVDDDSRLQVWDIHAEELHSEFPPEEDFGISALCHPPTYLNKILLGSRQGPLRLVNIKTSAVIYSYPGWDSGVTALEASPAADIVGVGTRSGHIRLHNLRSDESLFVLRQDWGPVLALAFRMDGEGVLVSSGGDGNLGVWDLEERRLIGQMSDIHRSQPITGLSFILGEPIMITNGADNGIRTWIFDRPSGLARQLAERNGHSAPPNTIKFHGVSGEMVVSGSEDGTVREMSTWKDTKQQNLGTGGPISAAKAKKRHLSPEAIRYPGILELVSSTARESEWDNVVCRHRDSLAITTWTSRRHRLGAHHMAHQRFATDAEWRSAVCTAVEVTGCGNFVLLGYSSGHIDMWNIQSGLFRGSFKEKGDPKEIKHRGHRSAVRGLACDALNQTLISGGEDGRVSVWSLRQKRERARLNLEETLHCLALNRDSGLAALGGETKLLVIDSTALRIVRHLHTGLRGGEGPWRSVVFTANSEWLLTLDARGRVRVWDLPTSHLVDFLSFDSPCTSLAMSPTGEFLATSHAEKKGVYLWTNRSVFSPHFAMRPLPKDWEPTALDLPLSAPLTAAEAGSDEVDLEMEEEESYQDPVQIDGLISLSGLARPKWATLPHLDAVKAASKPKAAPAKPADAPFFLPTTMGLRDFDFTPAADEQPPVAPSKLVQRKVGSLRPRSAFAKALDAAGDDPGYREAFDRLKALAPPAIDMEIRYLGPDNGGSIGALRSFLEMIGSVLGSRRDWELAQAYLALFLKVHQDDLWSLEGERAELDSALASVAGEEKGSWGRLSSDFDSVLSTLHWITTPSL